MANFELHPKDYEALGKKGRKAVMTVLRERGIAKKSDTLMAVKGTKRAPVKKVRKKEKEEVKAAVKSLKAFGWDPCAVKCQLIYMTSAAACTGTGPIVAICVAAAFLQAKSCLEDC